MDAPGREFSAEHAALAKYLHGCRRRLRQGRSARLRDAADSSDGRCRSRRRPPPPQPPRAPQASICAQGLGRALAMLRLTSATQAEGDRQRRLKGACDLQRRRRRDRAAAPKTLGAVLPPRELAAPPAAATAAAAVSPKPAEAAPSSPPPSPPLLRAFPTPAPPAATRAALSECRARVSAELRGLVHASAARVLLCRRGDSFLPDGAAPAAAAAAAAAAACVVAAVLVAKAEGLRYCAPPPPPPPQPLLAGAGTGSDRESACRDGQARGGIPLRPVETTAGAVLLAAAAAAVPPPSPQRPGTASPVRAPRHRSGGGCGVPPQPPSACHADFLARFRQARREFFDRSAAGLASYGAQRLQAQQQKQAALRAAAASAGARHAAWAEAARGAKRAASAGRHRQAEAEHREGLRRRLRQFEAAVAAAGGGPTAAARGALAACVRRLEEGACTPAAFEEAAAALSGVRYLEDDAVSVLCSLRPCFGVSAAQFAAHVRARMGGLLASWGDGVRGRLEAAHAAQADAEAALVLRGDAPATPGVVSWLAAGTTTAGGARRERDVVAWLGRLADDAATRGTLAAGLLGTEPTQVSGAVCAWLAGLGGTGEGEVVEVQEEEGVDGKGVAAAVGAREGEASAAAGCVEEGRLLRRHPLLRVLGKEWLDAVVGERRWL